MSEAKKLNVLNTVTSLGSGDYLLATDANGSARRISTANLEKNNLTKRTLRTTYRNTGWVRVTTVISDGSAGMLFVSSSWFDTPPRPMVLAFAVPSSSYGDGANSTVVKVAGDYANFPKARVVYPSSGNNGNASFIELYKASNGNPTLGLFSDGNSTLPSWFEAGSIPDGYTAIEFDLTKANSLQSGGGG